MFLVTVSVSEVALPHEPDTDTENTPAPYTTIDCVVAVLLQRLPVAEEDVSMTLSLPQMWRLPCTPMVGVPEPDPVLIMMLPVPMHTPLATVTVYVPPVVTVAVLALPRLLLHVYEVYPAPALSVSILPGQSVCAVAVIDGVGGVPDTVMVAVLDVSEQPLTVTSARYAPDVDAE